MRNMNQSAPQTIDAAGSMQGMYNHLGRSDSIGSAHSLGGVSINSESNLSYSRLERLPSWGSQSSYPGQRGEQYNRLNPVPSESSIHEESYDRLARSPSTTSRTLAQSLVSVDWLCILFLKKSSIIFDMTGLFNELHTVFFLKIQYHASQIY